MSEMIKVTLSSQILSELEPIATETHKSVETIVNEAIVEYLRLWQKRKLRVQLAKEYEDLALMWNELIEDLADEKWLPIENEALLQFEKGLAD